MRWRELRPEPGNFWIRWCALDWPDVGAGFTHLGLGTVAVGSESGPVPRALELPDRLEDTVYLPPVAADDREVRARWIEAAIDPLRDGGPLYAVIHRPVGGPWGPGETEELPPGRGLEIWDPTPAVLAGESCWWSRIPAGADVVWPLIPGWTTDPEALELVCRRLVERRVSSIQPLALQLDGRQRRWLYERRTAVSGDEPRLSAMFSGRPPDRRRFCQIVARHGLAWSCRRPGTPGSVVVAQDPREGTRRGAVALLVEIGDLWLGCGRSEARGQVFYRAARRIGPARYDLRALWREQNLGFVEGLEPPALEVLGQWLERGRSELLDELRREYGDEGRTVGAGSRQPEGGTAIATERRSSEELGR